MLTRLRTAALAAFVTNLGLHVTAHAAELSYSADLDVGHSDNIRRTRDNKVDETIVGVGAEVGLSEQTRRIDAVLAADLRYLEYVDNSFDSEVVGRLDGNARFAIVPEHVLWVVEDRFGQVRREQAEVETPDNREYVNYVSTGPDVKFNLGTRTLLEFGGRYSNVYYEKSDLGSDRTQETASLVRVLSGASRVSLNGRAEQIEFEQQDEDDLTTEDFDRAEAYLRYELAGARTTLSVAAGYSKVEGTDFEEDGTLVRIELSRRISTASVLALRGGREFSDASSSFRQLHEIEGPSGTTQSVQEVAGPFLNTYYQLSWAFEHRNTRLGFSGSHYEEDYELQPSADRKRYVASAYAQRKFARTTSLRFEGSYGQQKLQQLGRDFADLSAGVIFDWQLGRHVFTGIEYWYYGRTDDDIAASEYHENQIWLRFGYRSNRSGAP